jgi:5-(carboxyamino)imidazole ribonucleotide synthase
MSAPSSSPTGSVLRVGIVGGGQLARMMAEAAPRLGVSITVLDPTPGAPASEFASQIVGGFDDRAALRELALDSDVVTLDIEAVSAAALAVLEESGVRVAPSSRVLGIIQDKFVQKRFLDTHGLPGGRYAAIDDAAALLAFGLPCILKARRHGYDGRGVKRVKSVEDAAELLAAGPCMAEEIVDIDKELAIMVARNARGEIALYPVVEAEFDAAANILNTIKAPALVSEDIAATCAELATRCVTALDGTGIFGIEFFLDRGGRVLINEISPRPHNSGHYTIEACATSQFEQHLRAVTNMPLGPTTLLRAAASFNLLGEPDAFGRPVYAGLEEARRAGDIGVHLYGKLSVKPWRKMGHVTVTADSGADAADKAARLKTAIKVGGTGK